MCTNYFNKGLLEWILSTESAVEFLRYLPRDEYFEINYDEFVDHPVETILQVLDFIGVDSDENVKSFVSDRVTRRNKRMGECDLSEKDRMIGGKLLPLSMNGINGLTKRCI